MTTKAALRIAALIAAQIAALVAGAAQAAELPRFDAVKAAWRPSDSVLLDRHGEPIHTLRTDASVRRLEWVPLAEVSPALRTALVLSEDKRFYEHSGVDWPAVGAAAFGNLWSSRTRGASTLTMQLAGLLDDAAASRAGGRSFTAKLAQAGGAWQLERHWRKDQIFEAYLNLVPFRGELVGIGALSATLFAKHPGGLDAQEAALATALLRAPNAPAATVAQRACGILKAQGLGCEGLDGLAALALARKTAARLDPQAQIAPHVAQRLLNGAPEPAASRQGPHGGQAGSGAALRSLADTPARVPSTLDARLQRMARDALRRQLAELGGRQVEDGAVLVLDNASGDVLAWVGSSGAEWSRAPQVDGVLARRQAGSTLKPFLYELAIEQRWLTAASLLDDSPLGLETIGGLYVPENYDHGFKGPVSVRTALASSLNVPAVRTLVAVSPEAFHQRLQSLGLALRASGGTYGHSLALGSAEVTLAALTNAYRALANGGRAGPWRLQPGATHTPPAAVMDPAASFIVADILADREARALTFGLDNALAARRWAAVKTGTSKDMRDNWCIGFTRRHTVGVWVGNASGQPMADVSGTSGAAPVWRAMVDALMAGEPGAAAGQAAAPPPAPAGVVRQAVRYEPAVEPPRGEWFLAGTEQARIARAEAAPAASLIAAPLDSTVFALDPDIPPAAQRLRIAPARALPTGWRWRLDGRLLGSATPRHLPPWPGMHRLELLDGTGTMREMVRFEVRGAQLRAGGSVAGGWRGARH